MFWYLMRRTDHIETPAVIIVNTTTARKQRVVMATFHRERVEHALNELLVRIIPEDPNEDEEAANQRFEDAFDFAIDELEGAGEPPLVPDVNHIASLIDSRGTAVVLNLVTVR